MPIPRLANANADMRLSTSHFSAPIAEETTARKTVSKKTKYFSGIFPINPTCITGHTKHHPLDGRWLACLFYSLYLLFKGAKTMPLLPVNFHYLMHIRSQNSGDGNIAMRVLVIFHNRHQGTSDG